MTIDVNALTDAEFKALPLLVEGESKVVRIADGDHVVIRFKPTIYSYTANRTDIIPGSDALRMRATRVLVNALRSRGIRHGYEHVGDRYILAQLETPPPIETIVKAFHTGTSKHRYFGMDGTSVRRSHPFHPGHRIVSDGSYPQPLVRFDWRNPMYRPMTDERLADEVLPETMADWYIDTAEARYTALATFHAISNFLNRCDVVLYDICLFISADGRRVFGELSPDCGRFRHYDLGSLDKDVWRAGGSSKDVMAKWTKLVELMESVVT